VGISRLSRSSASQNIFGSSRQFYQLQKGRHLMIIFTEQEEWIKKNASSTPGGDYEKTTFDQKMRSCRSANSLDACET
jgi:hypothetical protein